MGSLGREKKAVRDERLREDALAVMEGIKVGGETVGVIAKSLPWAALIMWSYRQFAQDIQANTMDEARLELIKRWTLTVTPFMLTLGGLYQGLAGGLSSLFTSALTNVVGAMLIKERPLDPNRKTPGHFYYLDWLDALFLASWLPLILMSVSGKDVEKNPTLIV